MHLTVANTNSDYPVSHRTVACIIALFAATSFGAISLLAFSRLADEESSMNTLIDDLVLGRNRFVFTPDQGGHSCFGEAILTLDDDRHQFQIALTAWIRLKLNERIWMQEFAGKLVFNPLGQLGGSIVNTTFAGIPMRFGTVNINPMTLIINDYSDHSTKKQFRQNVPGPVELRHLGSNHFRLIGPAIARSFPTSALDVSVAPIHILRNEKAPCLKEVAQPFDLSHIITPLQQLASKVKTLLPDAIHD